jgi:hypothetical protein
MRELVEDRLSSRGVLCRLRHRVEREAPFSFMPMKLRLVFALVLNLCDAVERANTVIP